jgi:hypothetical protein
MSPSRKTLSPRLEAEVLTRCRRKCCLCVFLENRDAVRRGQIAHLNRRRDDDRFDNLVWLCLDHHDEYDSRSSQSKGLTEAEVRRYRDRLIARYPNEPLRESDEPFQELPSLAVIDPEELLASPEDTDSEPPVLSPRPWRFPLWQTADQLDFFAYLAPSRMDGVCLIERIDLPDGRIVIACLQMPSNPGTSITNAVEAVCAQVCERFEIAGDRLVWLEHYPFSDPLEWDQVTFAHTPPASPLAGPTWTKVTQAMWMALGLSPRKSLRTQGAGYRSKLRKHFPWPPSDV